MKNFYAFLACLTLLLLAGTPSIANTIIVKGYVKYSNGTPVANHPVTISTDSTPGTIPCYQVHTKFTNANGYYIDTLTCTGIISYFKIVVPNCNGAALVENVAATNTTGVYERNFVICNPATTTCVASFSFTKIAGAFNVVAFNSSQSHAGNTNDSIIKRRWRFGNGDSLMGNVVNPVYTYSHPGNYQACLTIVTALGCEKTICQNIYVGDTIPRNCQSYFTFNSLATNNKTIKFNSTPSTPSTSPNDQIVSRTWRFGDGDTLAGNNIDPTHTYLHTGTYTVCLVIKTAAGCVSDICKTVVINNIHCQAKLVFTHLPATSPAGFPVKFFSGNSTAAPGDSITERIYKFGDGTASSGNALDVTKVYTTMGTYTACLIIRTASGCSDTSCVTVVVPGPGQIVCKAEFIITPNNTANYKQVKFNSSSSYTNASDQIVSRIWKFGDGDSLTGNVIEPIHNYANDGVYTVCLTIRTVGGCTSTFCKVVEIRGPKCNAVLSFTHLTSSPPVAGFPVKFYSANSTTAAGDSITERIYKFGDGTVSSGNALYVTKVYASRGTYTACLIIRTAKGCSDTSCVTVVVPGPGQIVCKAEFIITPNNTANYKQIKLNSSSSYTNASDYIIKRVWNFGDGNSVSGNVIEPIHTYANDGVYTVCLTILTVDSCSSTFCKVVEIRGPKCKAVLNFVNQPISSTTTGFPVKFYSANSSTAAGDSITERIYKFGDGTVSSGNALDVTKVYTNMGTYTACLIIRTAKGCSDTSCVTVTVPQPGQIVCKANFNYVPSATSVKFQSNISTFTPGDSIISRHWTFGDNTTLTGNIKDPVHAYAQPGVYTVCLKITTATGCTSTECKQVITTHVVSNCIPQFTAARIAPKKISFNSSMSWVPANDTIIERKWEFGDGTTLGGNVVSPVKDYNAFGIYTVCLRIKTAKGCDNRICMPVRVQDSTNITPTNEPIKIVQMYPIPAHTQLNTVVWSQFNNVTAMLAIYDIYGVQKWSITKVLLQGNNFTNIPVSNLLAGPYFFRVTTMYGIKGKPFYKF